MQKKLLRLLGLIFLCFFATKAYGLDCINCFGKKVRALVASHHDKKVMKEIRVLMSQIKGAEQDIENWKKRGFDADEGPKSRLMIDLQRLVPKLKNDESYETFAKSVWADILYENDSASQKNELLSCLPSFSEPLVALVNDYIWMPGNWLCFDDEGTFMVVKDKYNRMHGFASKKSRCFNNFASLKLMEHEQLIKLIEQRRSVMVPGG